MSQRPPISCATVSADVLLQLDYFLLEGWLQDVQSGHEKTFHSTKHMKIKAKIILKTYSMGVHPVQLPSAGQLTG